MATFVCPKQHESTEPDYCSECGARIEGAPEQPSPAAPPLPETCPACGAAREQTEVVFCEICGYNFATGARGEVPAAPASVSASVPPPAPSAHAWTIEISVDPAMREPGSPDPPADVAASTVTLRPGLNLIGRRSTARAIHPEIDLSFDTAVSHRHALIEINPAGSAFLRDIGAANGTRLNGKQIEQLQDHPLAPGDRIILGHWSQLLLKAVD